MSGRDEVIWSKEPPSEPGDYWLLIDLDGGPFKPTPATFRNGKWVVPGFEFEYSNDVIGMVGGSFGPSIQSPSQLTAAAKRVEELEGQLATLKAVAKGAIVEGATEGEWRIGDGTRPFYASESELIGTNTLITGDARDFIMGQFNWNFKELAIANAKQAALAVNAIRQIATTTNVEGER